MLEFPKTNIKATGTAYETRNETEGNFYGHIKEIRAIKSQKDPTVFGVVDIKAEKEPGVFQFFLHYNPDNRNDRPDDPESSPASRSVGFLKNSATSLAIACGKTPTAPKAGNEMAWAQEMFNHFATSGDKFHFHQGRTSRGVEITFTTESSAPKDEENSLFA